jgi:hypothetical protein
MVKLPDQPHDPQLKAAMEEIKAIIAKYDCAAIVVLQSPTHAEHLFEVSPSWSCLSVELGGKVRFKAAMKTGGAAEKERGRVTTGMIMGFIDEADLLKDNFTKLAKMLTERGMSIEHVSRFTPHEP